MTSINVTSAAISSSDNRSDRPTLLFCVTCFVIGWIVQVAIYAPMFKVLPAGDDFPILNEIHRGNSEGPLSFFKISGHAYNYRPIKSLGIWAAGNVSPDSRIFWIHVLHFASVTTLSLVALLWIRTVPLGNTGVSVAILVMFLHPGLVASIGSLDGFDSTLSTAFLWLGAWFVYRFRENLILACAMGVMCFLIGGITKEYVFALVPLGAWSIFHFSQRNRFGRAAILSTTLLTGFSLLMLIRKITMPEGRDGGTEYLSFDPGQWASNLSLFVIGTLLPGNTMWVFLNRFSPLLLAAIPLIALLGAVVVGGVWTFWKEKTERHTWMIYLAVATGLAMFPMIVMYHVSEMYLPPVIVPFALLCGLSADGWRRYGKGTQIAIAVLSVLMLGNSIWAITDKIASLRRVGDRTEMQIDQLLAILPKDAENVRIAIAYNTFGMKANRRYSVFAMGDEIMLAHEDVLDWKARGRNLRIATFPNMLQPPPEDAQFDYYAAWDHQNNRMYLTKREFMWN